MVFFLLVTPTKDPIGFQSNDVGISPNSIFEYNSPLTIFHTCKV